LCFTDLEAGGDHVTVAVDGQQMCNNIAKYGTSDAYKEPTKSSGVIHGGGHSKSGPTTHLSQINDCLQSGLQHDEMKPGQNWTLTGYYDFDAHPGMPEEVKNETVWDEVMAISLFYLKQP
jgi:hypothetical protein